MLTKTIPILLIALGVGALPLRAGILEQLFYDGIPGVDVQDLKDAPGFPDNPNDFLSFEPDAGFRTPRAQGTDFGSLIKGYVMSPVTGTVTFFVASDDASEFSLSTDETSGNLQVIAFETGCCTGVFNGDRLSERSGSVELVAGGIYYFEAIYKEGGGGDWMDVGWELPDGTQEVIPSGFLFPATLGGAPVGGAPVFALEPLDAFVDEGAAITFTGHVSGAQPMTFQWKKNGANIAGATFGSYTIAVASVADDFASFKLVATNASGSVESFGATLFVTPDTTVPEVKSADDRGNVNAVSIFFSEPVAEAGALNKSNYSIDNGAITISDIMLSGNKVANGVGSPGATRVTLTIAESFENGSDHTIRISGIQDLANTPNLLATATVSFSVGSTGGPPDLGPGTIGEGLVAHWGFEGDFLDDVGEFHGTPMGTGNHEFVDGPDGFGSALHLDGGDDYVEITGGDENDLEMAGGDLSISGWFRVGGFDKSWQALIAKGEGGRWRVHRRGGGNVLAFTGGGSGDTPDTGPNVDDGQWHHFVAIAREGANSELWIDGAVAAARDDSDSLQDSNVNVQIGGNPDTGNRTWNGDIDDIGIWNRILTPDDIEVLLNNSITSILGGGGALGPVGIAEDGDLPASVVVAELNPFEIKIEVTGPGPFTYQWLRNGEPIAGETSRTYSIPSIAEADSGDISVLVQNEFSAVESRIMVLDVATDLDKPEIAVFEGSASFDRATVVFTEEVTAATAGDASNYVINNLDTGEGLAVIGVTVRNSTTVLLETAQQMSGQIYQVIVNGVEDVSDLHNSSVDATGKFTGWQERLGGLSRIAWVSTNNNLDDFPLETRGKGRFDLVDLPLLDDGLGTTAPYFETPNSGDINTPPSSNVADNYKAVLFGWLHPPVTGNYRFSFAADDNAELYLSTDEDPQNSVLIGLEPNWNPVRAFALTNRRDAAFPENLSDTYFPDGIPLVAGEKYYIEGFFSEGGGGDNMATAWRIPGDDSPFADGDLPIAGEFLSAVLPVKHVFFTENFEGLELGPNVDEALAGDAVWTKEAPPGWSIDDSGVPGVGDPLTDGVTEWAGWSFANKDWWAQTAGDQNRTQFTLGVGTVAIADGDEWDDQPHDGGPPDGPWLATFMSTGAFDISGVRPGTLVLEFDSSWRPEDDSNYHQTANVKVSYDGGDPIEVLLWESVAGDNFHADNTNESVVLPLDNPEGASELVITFGYFDAGNDWWWAIDNIEVNDFDLAGAGLEPEPEPPVLGEGLVAIDGGLTRVAWNGPGVTLDFYPEDSRGKFRFDTIELESRTDSQGNFATYFETPNSGDINVAPEGDFFGDYAVILYGFIHPAETGTYRFALAADDYAALYLSTDEDPANTVLIASEPLWNPVRSFGSTDRRPNGENLSEGIELVAGQKYYVEAIMKEAGGGDNIAVAWKGPGDDSAFADGDLPISGDFLSGFAPPVPGTLYVEAEDFDFDGGSWVSDVNTGLGGAYAGNAYDGLGGIQGIDFDGAGSTRAYRTTDDPAPSIDKNSGPDDVRNARDGFIVESNWIMGWNDTGDWTNYTRDFPHGSYWVSGDFSSGGSDISVQLDVVTDGAGTDAQTLSKLGEFNGVATGSWDVFAPIQLANDDGSPAVISLGGVQTLRLTALPGNMDVNFLKFTPKQALYIEAEDFDFDGGSWIASGTGFDGPYAGNAYNGLGGTQGIDFDGAGSTRAYRTTGDPGPSVDKESAADDVRNARDGFELESNWILGWNDPGDWTNYTRDFPEDNYEVVGMFSSGGSDISAQLDVVVDGAGTDSQTLEKLGEFNGAATGNWDVFALIQLRDDSGNPAVVSLAGVQTLRITTLPGNLDWNFIKFFPSVRGGGAEPGGSLILISVDADGNLVLNYEGALLGADNVEGPYEVVDGASSPTTVAPDAARRFYQSSN